jgi:hypothetical protein
MTIPKIILIIVEKDITAYCEEKVPLNIRDKVRLGYKIRGNSITLLEIRPHYSIKNKLMEESIAKIKYLPETNQWQLFNQDRNLRWQKYLNFAPYKKFSKVLEEIDRDPTCIFWG